jgi:hypothetical protein
MKKVMIAASFVIVATLLSAFNTVKNEDLKIIESVSVSAFCEGWEDGYCEGWKDVKGSMSLCPLTPLCPLPEIGQDTYRGGYNRGFKAGMRAAYNN